MMLQRSLSIMFVLSILLAPSISQAQDATTDYVHGIGMPDSAVVLPVEVGFYNAANGALHLDIPMGTVTGRNGKQLQIKLTYDSKLYAWSGAATGSNPYLWQPVNVHGSEGGWKVVIIGGQTDYLASGCSTVPAFQPCVGVNYSIVSDQPCEYGSETGDVQYTGNWAVETAGGVTKSFSMVQTAMANPTLGTCGMEDNPTSSGFADDGSGYFLVVTNYTEAALYDPAGNKIGIEDENGNLISTDANRNLIDELSRTPVIKSVNGNLEYYDVLNPQGGRSRYTLAKATFNVNTAFGRPYTSEYAGTVTTLQSFTLPDGTSYAFTYDFGTAAGNYGLLTAMTLPTGGMIQYGYGTFVDVRGESSRWLTSRNSQGNIWSYTPVVTSQTTQQLTVTKPNGESVAYSFNVPDQFGAWNTASTYFDGAGTMVQNKTIDYFVPPGQIPPASPVYGAGHFQLPIRVTTSIPTTGATIIKKTEYSYDSCNNVSEIREWDWYTGTAPAATRITDASYTCGSSVYFAKNILDRPTSVIVKDGNGNPFAQTNIEYDNYTAGISSSGAVQHDPAFGTGYTLRGNVTAVQRWRNTDGAWLTTRNQYDDVGNILSTSDPLGHTTTFDFTDSWSSFSGSGGASACAPSGGQAKAYVTKVTNALGHVTTKTYYSCTGASGSTTDPNGQTTSQTYDGMNRPLVSSYPDGGQNSICYSEVAGTSCSNGGNPFQIVVTKKLNSSVNMTTTDVMDTMGRRIQAQMSTPSCTVKVDLVYDTLGRVSSTSNPYCSTNDSTYGLTQTQYDALGRVIKITKQDGSYSTISYNGNCATSTDEAGKSRKSCLDGLGRLTNIWENPAGFNYETDYQYDVLGNLLRVDQKGSAPTDNTQWRTRLFTYNSLSELLTANNPESGTSSYSYDGDGNVITKTAPAPNQTGSATATTTYSYDVLHRVTQKTYSDHSTPTAAYTYDASAPWGWQLSNFIGRLVVDATYDANSGALLAANLYNHDSMGRVILHEQGCTNQNCNMPSIYAAYAFDLAGDVTSLTTSQGNIFGYSYGYTYDSAGRLTGMTSTMADPLHPGTLASGFSYNATGGIQQMSYGNGLTNTNSYTNRLQPVQMRVYNATSGTDSLNLTYGFNWGGGDSGNLSSMVATGNGAFNRTYSYDVLNRLATMTDTNTAQSCRGLSWNYDPWGNRTDQNVTAGTCNTFHNSPATTKNQLNGAPYQYDAAGNLTNDGTHSYTYDAENRITKVDGGATTYNYDAQGHRITKTTGGVWRNYLYGTGGEVLAETTAAGWQVGYGYLGGQLLAEYKDSQTYFVHHDHLGSTRVLTAAGAATRIQSSGGTSTWKYYYTAVCPGTTGVSYTVSAWVKNQGTASMRISGNIVDGPVIAPGTTQHVSFTETGNGASCIQLGFATINVGDPMDVVAFAPVITSSDTNMVAAGNQNFSGWNSYMGAAVTITQGQPVFVADTMDYLPYGEQIAGSSGTTHKFTGKERDDESGLDYFGKRYNSSGLGRFMSTDTARPHLDNPQSLNRYIYSLNNPVTLVDPDGLDPIDANLLNHIVNFNSYARSLVAQSRDTVNAFLNSGNSPGGLSPAAQAILARAAADILVERLGNDSPDRQAASPTIQENIIENAAENLAAQTAFENVVNQFDAWLNLSSTSKSDRDDAFHSIQDALDKQGKEDEKQKKYFDWVNKGTSRLIGPKGGPVMGAFAEAMASIEEIQKYLLERVKQDINDKQKKENEKKKKKENEAQRSGPV